MKLEVVRAFANASIADQVTAVQLVDHMRFDRLATRNPAQWAAAVAEELRTAGMPAHLLDGPTSPAERLAAAEAKLNAAWKRHVAARTVYEAAELELDAYRETSMLLGGWLAEAAWTADATAWTATTTVDGVRYRYTTRGPIGIGQRLWVLTACPTNRRHDHAARSAPSTPTGSPGVASTIRPGSARTVCARPPASPPRRAASRWLALPTAALPTATRSWTRRSRSWPTSWTASRSAPSSPDRASTKPSRHGRAALTPRQDPGRPPGPVTTGGDMATPPYDASIGAVLSITTGRLLAPMSEIHQLLDYLTGDRLFTHQLPRAARECRPHLLALHPQLADVRVPDDLTGDAPVRGWVTEQAGTLGARLAVVPLDAADHTRIRPLAELRLCHPDAVVIPIVVDRDDPATPQQGAVR